jgi:hypothetical protein
VNAIWSTAAAVVLSLGGGGVIVIALSSWLGKVWASRIAEAERARFSRDIEGYKNDLRQLSEERRDALTRKRDIYARLAVSMRVFLAAKKPSSDDEKREFLMAFDQAALWASEEVAQTLSIFVECSIRNTRQPGSVSNDELKNAYRACLNAMRLRISRYEIRLPSGYFPMSAFWNNRKGWCQPYNKRIQRARDPDKGVLCWRHRRVADLRRYTAQSVHRTGHDRGSIRPFMRLLVQ